MEHQGHWLCRIHDASEELYEACVAAERALETGENLSAALWKIRRAIEKAAEGDRTTDSECGPPEH